MAGATVPTAGATAPAAPDPSQQSFGGYSPADVYTAVRAVVGEAANQSPDVQRMVLSTVLNRANASGQSINDVASDPSVYQGYNSGPALHIDPSSPTYKAVLSNVAPVFTNGPTTQATHFYNPSQPGATTPSWAGPDGVKAGSFLFYNRSSQLPRAAPPPDSAFVGGSTEPAGSAAPQAAQPPPDTAFAGGVTDPTAPPGQPSTPPAPQGAAPVDPLSVYPKASGLIPQLAQATGVEMRAAANGASLGLADRLEAGTRALPALLQGPDAYMNQFSSDLDDEKMKDAAGQEAYPLGAIGANLLGGAAPAAAMPEVAASTLLGRAAVGAGQGALLGGTEGVLNSRGNLGQMARGAAVPMVEGAALGGTLGSVFGAAHPADSAPRIASMNDYAMTGVDPSLALNGPESAQRVAMGLKGLPFVGTPLNELAERTTSQLNAGATRAAEGFGQSQTPYEAGSALQSGANAAVGRMKATTNQLYKPLNQLETSTVPVPTINTEAAIKDIFGRYPNVPEWMAKQAPKLVDVQKTIAGAKGKLTYGELKAMRSDVGDMINDHFGTGNIDQARLKRLYGAMSDDMSAGAFHTARTEALNAGAKPGDAIRAGQSAADALSRADAYHSAVQTRVQDTLKKVIGDNVTPEQAYGRLVSAMSSKQSADLNQVRRVVRTLDDKTRGEFAAGLLRRMGRASESDDAFSPAKFSTEWSKLTPEAKRLVFGNESQRETIDALSRIAKQQTGASKFYNHSNSAHSGALVIGLEAMGQVGEHLAGGHLKEAVEQAATFAMSGIGGRAVATLLASPRVARLVLKSATAKSPSEIAAFNDAMVKEASMDPKVMPALRAYAAQYVQHLRENIAPAVTNSVVGPVNENVDQTASGAPRLRGMQP